MATRTKRTDSVRRDLYAEVTNKIIADLEAGIAPWARPWGNSGSDAAAMPSNAVTGRRYSGVNVLLLWGAAQQSAFTSSRWLTFNQARDAGGSILKGSKGTLVVYADKFVPAGERERSARDGDDARVVHFLKSFVVFNLDQTSGLDHLRGADIAVTEREQHDAAEALIAATGAEFRVGGNDAFYSPSHDFVQIPPRRAARAQVNYYRTAFHELGHATGYPSRLARKLLNQFGSKDYAREELVAEMTAAFVCASMGIQPTVRHADYIGSWLRVLREDSRAIFRAASAASKAADWLFACQPVAMELAA